MIQKELSQQQRLTRAMIEFIERYEWNHVCTLTFREARSAEAAKTLFHIFARRLATIARRPIYWFVTIEQTTMGHNHIHALMLGTADIAVATLDAKWRERHGHARISIYDPSRGAIKYVTKNTALDSSAWEINPPPLKTIRERR